MVDPSPASLPEMPSPEDLRTLVARRRPAFLEELKILVAIDSGTDSPAGVNRVVDRYVRLLEREGWQVARSEAPVVDGRRFGDVVVARISGHGGGRILLLGHTDTVFPDGTAAARPFREEGGRATGPGVSDMKAGLLAGIHAVGALRDRGFHGFQEIVFVLCPDEERGSPASRPTIEREAARSDATLVLEAARESGAVVSSRKGCTTVRIEVRGRAAHAGVEPERGRNALLEAARKVEALQGLNGRWEDATVNVGVLQGGSRPNVVADRAALEVDLRATSEASLLAIEAEVERIGATSTVEGVVSTVVFEREHRPMERTAGTVALVAAAREVAAALGLELPEASTGGASDANTTSALGVPTLDGLGPIGGDDHSEREWLDVTSIVPRTALLAGLIAKLGVRDV